MASFQYSGALTLWGLWIGRRLSLEPLPSFIIACADSKQANRHCSGPRGLCHGSEAQDQDQSCHGPYSSAYQIASLSTGTGFMAVWSAEMHVWPHSRLNKLLQGGPCSYYDLQGIAITTSALRQNERTAHSADACVCAPVRNKPRKCVQWTSAPHRRAICLVVPISCCVDTLVADSPILTVTVSRGSHCGKRRHPEPW